MKSDSYARRVWMICSPLALYLGISMVVSVFATAIFSSKVAKLYDLSTQQGIQDAYKAIMEMIYDYSLEITGVLGIVCIPILYKMFRKDSKRLVDQKAEQNPYNYVLLGVLGVTGSLSLNVLLSVSGVAEYLGSSYENTAAIIYSAPVWVQFVVSSVVAPILEELMFRGLVFRRMRTYCIFPLAMLVSAILFGAYHGNLLQFIYATLLGFILAFAYEKYNTILAPIIIHACANAFSIVLANAKGIEQLLDGTETRLMVTTVVSTVIAIICLVLLGLIKNDKTNQDEDGLVREIEYE